jgi:hypothetical protein
MSTIQEIEAAVRQLAPADLARFREWFADFEAEAWDRQIAEDSAAGRLDAFAEEALKEFREGKCTEL